MTTPSIPIAPAPAPAPCTGAGRLTDSHGRAITDLRVSVTDRCNYRCIYCRTGNDGAQYSELPLADYLRIVRVFVSLGIEKVRLTGGEPLLRRDLTTLIREIAQLRTAMGRMPDRSTTPVAVWAVWAIAPAAVWAV